MKVAVTIWESRISPVFDASRHVLIVRIEAGRIEERINMVFDPDQPAQLARNLARIEVPVLICGAISQVPAAILTANNMTLIPFISGKVDQVLAAYASGQTLSHAFGMPGCQHFGSTQKANA